MSYEGKFNAAELHFECSFQGYPTCLFFSCHLPPATWPPGHLATCHLATWSAKTIGKRGIPEKSIQNVAQLRWNYLRRTLQSKVMAENRVLGNRPLYFTLQKSGTQFQRKESYLSKTSFVTFFCIDIWHTKSECYCQNSKICFLWTALIYMHALSMELMQKYCLVLFYILNIKWKWKWIMNVYRQDCSKFVKVAYMFVIAHDEHSFKSH